MPDHPFDAPPVVDWIPAEDLGDGRPGRIGMTVLPGKQGRSVRYPGRTYRADLDTDLESLRAAGIRHLFLLVEDEELARWGDPAIADRATAHDIVVHRHPMADGRAPASSAAMDRLIGEISGARDSADVAVACMGGVGRTGTVAASALVASGWEPDVAIQRVRGLRHPTAVETPEQEAFVRSYQCTPGRPRLRSPNERSMGL